MACWAVNKADLPISTSLLIAICPSTELQKFGLFCLSG
jgi:hypothetical protein